MQHYTFMMCEKFYVSFVWCAAVAKAAAAAAAAGPYSRKRNAKLFTQWNSLHRIQIGGQLKTQNDKTHAKGKRKREKRDETVRVAQWMTRARVCVRVCVYVCLFLLWRLSATTIKPSLPLSKRKSICTQITIHMQLLVAPCWYREKYAFISRSINANVKIIQIDGTRYSSRERCWNVPAHFWRRTWQFTAAIAVFHWKYKNIKLQWWQRQRHHHRHQ